VHRDLLPRYVEVKVFQAVPRVDRERARRAHDRDGERSKNASEMIERLTLEMNRARQATITKELMEIVAAPRR
jgi:F-type H+-transporting ATPase subunit gamma